MLDTSKLKPGDDVVVVTVSGGLPPRLGTVARVGTNGQVVLADGSCFVGESKWLLCKATDEAREQVRRHVLIMKIHSSMWRWQDLPTPTLEAIAAVLAARTEDAAP